MMNPLKYVGPLAQKLLIPGLVCLMSLFSVSSLAAQAVLTWHNDTARTGQNLEETLLTPSSVNSSNFGLIYTLPLDGKVDAQPLYVPGVSISGVTHNILYVVTENDSVYALDADSGAQLWMKTMLGSGETASPQPSGCDNITPTIGITSTPAIDMSIGPNGTIYLVALSTDGTNYFQRLHALDLTTGIDQTGWPIVIAATYPGNSPNGSGTVLTFDPSLYTERAALLISNGVVYTTWASHCDNGSYNSWVIGYNESTQAQSVINLTPDGGQGGIWMAGAGPAADASGNIYFLIGNGTFDTTLTGNFPSGGDYGNSFMSLSTSSGLAVADYFTMDNTVSESTMDEDLGSGGALLLPSLNDAMGNSHQLAVGAGKDGTAYVVDRANMGEFNMSSNAVYQMLPLGGNQVFSTPAWFNNTLYYGPVGSPLTAYPFSDGSFSSSLAFSTSQSFGVNCANTGATPSISASGPTNGIVWVLDTPCNNSVHLPAVLYAFDAGTLNKLYDSTQNTSENFGNGITFPTPTVANGKVFIGTAAIGTAPGGVSAFGLCTFGSPGSLTVDSTAHTGGVTVTASSGACSWTASTTSDFITITGGQTGTGNGTVSYSVPANSGAQRTGTITITGQTFTKTYTITQAAPNSLVPPSNPVPANESAGVSLTPTLSWTGSTGATSYDVYFGTSPTPTLATNTTSTSYAPGTLSPGVTYYWGVLAKNSTESNGSPIWSFTTHAGGTTTAGLGFYSLPPCRVADTRASSSFSGAFGAPSLVGGATRNFPIPSSNCGVPSTAQAYSLNITVIPNGTHLGYLSAWPTGSPQPTVATLNDLQGQTLGNAAIVPAGTGGAISLYVTNNTDVVMDINGYFAPTDAPSQEFYPMTPCRVADTRAISGFTSPFGAPSLVGGATRVFPVQSTCGIPTAAEAYSLRMTVVPPGPLGYLTAYPDGQTLPVAATLNDRGGQVLGNQAIVPAGTNGAIDVYASANTDLIIDINGYFAPPGPGGLNFYPLVPCRVADTRVTSGFPGSFGAPSLVGGASRDFPMPTSPCGIPSSAQAYSLNLTAVGPTAQLYLTAWPTGQTLPVAATLNASGSTTIGGGAIVPAGTNGSISVYASHPTDLVIDINGYFAP